jgi:dTDP-4-dehydrorhamnose 3,5-epimerase-like enzyme
MALRISKHSKRVTKDKKGSTNGFLIPIYNVHDDFVSEDHTPKQVYVTICDVGSIKGPHLHLKRWGYFTCIKGNVRVIVRNNGIYEDYFSGEDYDYATIEIPPGTPAAIHNIAEEQSYVINTPSPAWHIDDQDEHPIEFDPSVFIWKKK